VPPLKKVLRAAAVLVGVYALLAFPWPGLARAFTGTYAQVAEVVMAPLLRPDTTFRPSVPGDSFDEWDLLVRFPPEPGATSVHGVRVHLRRIAYVPLAFAVAFVAAFPAPRQRLARGAAGVLAVLLSFEAFGILSVFTTRGALDLGGFLDVLVQLGSRVQLEAPGMTFALPALAWVALARPPLLADLFSRAFSRAERPGREGRAGAVSR
jgi:hypothetical protein